MFNLRFGRQIVNQYYDLSYDTGLCSCKTTNGKMETLTVAAASEVLNGASDVTDLNMSVFQAFNYECTLSNAIWSEGTCVNESKTFFNVNNVTTEIDQSTTILLFYLRINHVGNYNMSDECIRDITAHFVVMANTDGRRPYII